MIKRHAEAEYGLEAFEELETFEAHIEALAEQAAYQDSHEAEGSFREVAAFATEWKEAA